jgi:hypothetical protein
MRPLTRDDLIAQFPDAATRANTRALAERHKFLATPEPDRRRLYPVTEPGAGVWLPLTNPTLDALVLVWRTNGFEHRLDGPARISPDGRHEWWLHGTRHMSMSSVYLDEAWANDTITDAQANDLLTQFTANTTWLATWLTHLLLTNPSPHLTDTWRIIHAITQ